MVIKRRILSASLWISASIPLWGGTGRPSDGMLSFLLLLGFLLIILGILHLADLLTSWIKNLLNGMH
jgi:hypothetical protein